MAFTYPLSLAQFQDTVTLSVSRFYLSNPRQIDRTASGTQLSASLGEAIWRGSFTIPNTTDRGDSGRIDALLSVLDRAGSSFLIYDPTQPAPASGSTTSATISSLNSSDRRVMTITGGPTLAAGDLFSFTYGSSPTRYGLHRIVSVSGSTLEVTPFLPADVTVGTTLNFDKPVMKAVLLPDPDYGSHAPVVSGAKSFSFVQTLR